MEERQPIGREFSRAFSLPKVFKFLITAFSPACCSLQGDLRILWLLALGVLRNAA